MVALAKASPNAKFARHISGTVLEAEKEWNISSPL